MVDSEKKVPGISFELVSHKETGHAEGITRVKCELYGEYQDVELWEKIKKKLSAGFRIYGEEDFQGEVLLMMRSDFMKEEAEHAVTKQTLKTEVARRLKAEQELTKLKGLLESLGSGLGKR